MKWHADVLASHHLVGFDGLTFLALNSDKSAVKVHDREVDSGERVQKRDFFFHVQISSFSREDFVGSGFDHNNDIACFDLGNLVSFSVDSELLAIGRSFAHLDLKLLFIAFDFFALASFASFFHVDHFTLTTTVVTWTSGLRVHTWTHLSHFSNHTSSLAMWTGLDRRRVSTSNSVADIAHSLSVDVNFDFFAIVDICKAHFNLLHDGFHLLFLWGTPWSSTSKHLTENVAATTLRSLTFSSFFSVFVVYFSLIFVRKDVVCVLNFLELFCVTSLVGVVFDGELTVSFSNLIKCG